MFLPFGLYFAEDTNINADHTGHYPKLGELLLRVSYENHPVSDSLVEPVERRPLSHVTTVPLHIYETKNVVIIHAHRQGRMETQRAKR